MTLAILVLLAGVVIVFALLFGGDDGQRHSVSIDPNWRPKTTDKIPDPTTPTTHVIEIGDTWAACSCHKWSATFAVRGPLPMWARGHLMDVKGTLVDDEGVTPE